MSDTTSPVDKRPLPRTQPHKVDTKLGSRMAELKRKERAELEDFLVSELKLTEEKLEKYRKSREEFSERMSKLVQEARSKVSFDRANTDGPSRGPTSSINREELVKPVSQFNATLRELFGEDRFARYQEFQKRQSEELRQQLGQRFPNAPPDSPFIFKEER